MLGLCFLRSFLRRQWAILPDDLLRLKLALFLSLLSRSVREFLIVSLLLLNDLNLSGIWITAIFAINFIVLLIHPDQISLVQRLVVVTLKFVFLVFHCYDVVLMSASRCDTSRLLYAVLTLQAHIDHLDAAIISLPFLIGLICALNLILASIVELLGDWDNFLVVLWDPLLHLFHHIDWGAEVVQVQKHRLDRAVVIIRLSDRELEALKGFFIAFVNQDNLAIFNDDAFVIRRLTLSMRELAARR